MSEYYKTLPLAAKYRYLDKLSVMGLEEEDGPYANNGRLVDDMTIWPLLRQDTFSATSYRGLVYTPTAAVNSVEKSRSLYVLVVKCLLQI